jgi:hypothetical protein
VKGPSPLSVSTKPAAVTAATNVLKSGFDTATSTIVPTLTSPTISLASSTADSSTAALDSVVASSDVLLHADKVSAAATATTAIAVRRITRIFFSLILGIIFRNVIASNKLNFGKRKHG